MTARTTALDTRAAVTRSLLGWGVVAGPFYVVVGLVLALTRPGFDLSRHALSLLELGELGWLQRANLALTGLMVLAAALGISRAVRDGRGLAMSALTAVFGAGLLMSAIFAPDPVAGFPPGAETGSGSVSGILHLVAGALGFVAVAAAAFTYSRWCRASGAGPAWPGATLGTGILVAFVAGAALSQSPAGVALLWIAVLAAFGWVALASVRLYRWTPHPVTGERR